MTFGSTISVQTQGFSDIVDITEQVQTTITESEIMNGIVNVTAIGSTASVTTIEYEPALVIDMQELLNKLVPETIRSRHSDTWGDDNGFSHMRATLMGPGTTLPVEHGKLLTGTWQQVVVIDHDNRPRNRQIRIQIVGTTD
ncbi:MAG: secondary thiamine-phosphate synthase enzyme [Gemmatimonadaceae bacterium 4484_173]|nr:MAG: secondary thiamine-phosphate synthase enzyme [Gemmatimonadaceae bacterium 4484_173]